jgi:hypothetical protein
MKITKSLGFASPFVTRSATIIELTRRPVLYGINVCVAVVRIISKDGMDKTHDDTILDQIEEVERDCKPLSVIPTYEKAIQDNYVSLCIQKPETLGGHSGTGQPRAARRQST